MVSTDGQTNGICKSGTESISISLCK